MTYEKRIHEQLDKINKWLEIDNEKNPHFEQHMKDNWAISTDDWYSARLRIYEHFLKSELNPLESMTELFEGEKRRRNDMGFEEKIPEIPLDHPVDKINFDAQRLVAACLGIPFDNRYSEYLPDASWLDNLNRIPMKLIHFDTESSFVKNYESPLGEDIQTDFSDWLHLPDSQDIENLMVMYQMTGTLPHEAVPYIPLHAIFMHTDRERVPSKSTSKSNFTSFKSLKDEGPIEHNWIPKPLSFYGDRLIITHPNLPMEEEPDEPLEIDLIEKKPEYREVELPGFAFLEIGKWLSTKDLLTALKTHPDYDGVITQYAYLPHDVETVEELEEYDLSKIFQSPMNIHFDSTYEILSRHEAWIVVRFLLYMNEVCKECGYPKNDESKERNPAHWSEHIEPTGDYHSQYGPRHREEKPYQKSLTTEKKLYNELLKFYDIHQYGQEERVLPAFNPFAGNAPN